MVFLGLERVNALSIRVRGRNPLLSRFAPVRGFVPLCQIFACGSHGGQLPCRGAPLHRSVWSAVIASIRRQILDPIGSNSGSCRPVVSDM
jgi:hypothetical protein